MADFLSPWSMVVADKKYEKGKMNYRGGGVEPPLLLLLEANARLDAIMVDVIYGGIILFFLNLPLTPRRATTLVTHRANIEVRGTPDSGHGKKKRKCINLSYRRNQGQNCNVPVSKFKKEF
ncbi:hypothetical protein CFP56_036747 [Quercus suber]|uniref:Uncharacterized protein n=1 Tax=Quercus suber TaxID=58331 RepID=A0AAW0MCN6_QUESU